MNFGVAMALMEAGSTIIWRRSWQVNPAAGGTRWPPHQRYIFWEEVTRTRRLMLKQPDGISYGFTWEPHSIDIQATDWESAPRG